MSASSLQDVIDGLEAQRKSIAGLTTKGFAFIGTAILLAVIGFFFFQEAMLFFMLPAGAGLVFGMLKMNEASSQYATYRHEFKLKLLGGAMKAIDPSLEMVYQDGFSEQQFMASRLFDTEPDRYMSEDLIYGTAGKTKFSFCEIHAEYKTVTTTKHGRQEHWHDIFKGILFCADFNKNFQGVTVVKPKDISHNVSAWLSQNMPFLASEEGLVKLENPDFNECFVTYSTDQVEARYILSPAMMERICELESKSKYTISVSFIDNHIYIAFPLDHNYFEPSRYSSIKTSELADDTEVIQFMYNIISELNLNTRIWGKQ